MYYLYPCRASDFRHSFFILLKKFNPSLHTDHLFLHAVLSIRPITILIIYILNSESPQTVCYCLLVVSVVQSLSHV